MERYVLYLYGIALLCAAWPFFTGHGTACFLFFLYITFYSKDVALPAHGIRNTEHGTMVMRACI